MTFEKKRKTDDEGAFMRIVANPIVRVIVGSFIVGFSFNIYTTNTLSGYVTKSVYDLDKDYNYNLMMYQSAENKLSTLELKQSFFISRHGQSLSLDQNSELDKIKADLKTATADRDFYKSKILNTRGK